MVGDDSVICCGRSLEGNAVQFQEKGVLVIRQALQACTADALHAHVCEKLTETITAVDNGSLDIHDAFGAIAPPASLVPCRWNLLLDMNEITRSAIHEALLKSFPVFEAVCGSQATLCDLSALVADPGSTAQQLHFDTRYSDAEGSDEEVETTLPKKKKQNVQRQKRLVTAFVALQDVSAEMGPTLIVPWTNTKHSHEEVAENQHEEGASVLEAISNTGTACVLQKGDMVLMDSRTLHKGTANVSRTRRVLLDFAFMRPKSEPSTYCECIKKELCHQHPLESFRVVSMRGPWISAGARTHAAHR